MKKLIIVLYLVATTGAVLFAQEAEIDSILRNTIPEKVQKNFFLIYDSIGVRPTVNWDELKTRKPNPITKDLEKAQKHFLRAYKSYKQNPFVFHADARVQKTFDENVDIIYNIITSNLLQYGGSNTRWLIFYLEEFAFALKGKADNKDQYFIRDCYWVYYNADSALLTFFESY